MGLTIHYQLKSDTKLTEEARGLVEELREYALGLPFKEIGNIVEFKGEEECDFNSKTDNDNYRWLKIQSQRYIDTEPGCRAGVIPLHIIAFTTWPGEGCEAANFGLCCYPKSIERNGEKLPTKLGTGFSWRSFCKTQYASAPDCGGIKNFLKCHLTVISLLDYAESLGILKSVSDEGNYWKRRDIKVLAIEVGEYNNFVAAFSGALKDTIEGSGEGARLEGAILKNPEFERLEADFERKNPKAADNMRKTTRAIASLIGDTKKL